MSLVHYLDRDPKKDDRPALPTPREMIAYLNTHIIGQDQAKRDLAEAFYCHYIDLSARDEMIESGKLLRDSYRVYGSANTLMIGPTGCGKTEIVERLAEFADVPFSAHSAATMVPNGIVGESTDDMFYAPYVTCGREIGPVERSMVFIDEIDKMAVRRGDGQNNHPYGGSVQKALLRIVEGTRITLALEGTASGPKGLINTGRMFFVAGELSREFSRSSKSASSALRGPGSGLL
ncbi:MAG: AAA family ATPase [Acidobacteria bacterium]|nr:AAA family ATPase [Acidobacteriota bacterium]